MRRGARIQTPSQLCLYREDNEEAFIYDQGPHQVWHGIEDGIETYLEKQADEARDTSP